jgi:hypothetical protein
MATRKVAALIGPTYDLIASYPEGITINEMCLELDMDKFQCNQVIREIRRIFADAKENLVCEPQPGVRRQQWLYRMTGDSDKARFWISNRLNDTEARLGTILDVTHSISLATDARTIEGQKARKIHRTLEYLEKELAEITN